MTRSSTILIQAAFIMLGVAAVTTWVIIKKKYPGSQAQTMKTVLVRAPEAQLPPPRIDLYSAGKLIGSWTNFSDIRSYTLGIRSFLTAEGERIEIKGDWVITGAPR